MKALMISADDFEDSELLYPYYRLKEEGVEVKLVSPTGGSIKGKHGYEMNCDARVADVNADDFDLLVLPGGKAPETVRKDPAAIAISRSFFERNKPVAAICHGPQTLISAGLVKGRRTTCYRTVMGELRDAGGIYEDTEVVVDGNLVTSREPKDLPAFMRETLKMIKLR